ncbi:MAG: hypothetical protein HRU78_01705 [Gammaproteobacteria bacterium]|nr:MAG: hypothetical protein HRU78_01705 [Gammaproteobacteria bacterium]
MKIAQVWLLVLLSFLLQGNVFALSIAYEGFECQSAIDTEDPTPASGTSIQSRFEVTEDSGGGVYRLSLTGGIPRFVNNDHTVCIDKATAIGYSGIPEVDGLPQPLDSIDATAYFNGQELIVVVSSIYTDLSARRNPFSSFNTSLIFTFTNTLIFKFNPTTSSFTLTKLFRNRGFTQTTGSTNSITPFLETVLPSFNKEARDKPMILIPLATINYRLEK